MARLSNFRVPPPTNWQDFESLCFDLWRAIWKDTNAQKNGRQGQAQHGVDIFGRPDQGALWAGVQCKGKNNYDEKALTEKEVELEVEKAKSFNPSLSSFTIATSGKRDEKIQEFGRGITEKHLAADLFPVHIWSWEDILARLEEFPDVIEKHYKELTSYSVTGRDIDEVKEVTQKILENTGEIKSRILTQVKSETQGISSYVDISTTVLITEYQAEIDHSRDLLKDYNAVEAITYLEKLKGRIWANSTPIVKFRILTNIGAAKGLLNEQQESARLLIEALQYNPDDEKALCNAALGYVLLGSNDQAILHAMKVLELNPANAKAHSILIRSAPDTELPEEMLQRVPEPYRITPEVANAIGCLFHKKGNISESRKWLEIAVKHDTADSPELKAELGTILIKEVTDDQSSFFGVQINEVKRAQIERAIQLLTSAWDRVANTSIRHCRADWVTNRGLAKRLLAETDVAIEDVVIAVEAVPSDLSYKKYLAMLLHEKSENQKAIGLLKEIVETGSLPEASLLLGEVLREEGKIPEGIEIISKLLTGDCDEPVKEEAQRLLIKLYIDSNDLKSAKEVSSTLLAQNPIKIPYLVDAAAIEGTADKKVEALALLMKAKTSIDATTTTRHILEIADGLYEIEEFEEAALIYERVVDKTLNTPLSRRLMNSYYRAGMLGNALEICQVLHQRFGLTGYTVEMESAIWEEIGDLAKAKGICEAYLKESPGDSRIQLRLAVINLRSNNFEELDRFLDSAIEIKSLSLEHGLQYAGLLAVRNRGEKAFSVAYELRRMFFNDPRAHLKYMGIFLQREKDASDWLIATKVAVDMAVCIEEDARGREWYLVEDREDADARRREFNLNHPLVKQMLSKSVGETVVLVDSPYSKISGKIIEIKSKYVYAFQETLSSFETLFPGATGMWKVKMGIPRKEGAIPEGFQTVFDDISKQHEMGLLIEKLYKERKLTIGAFSILAGKDIMQVWNRLISSPEPGVIACNGSIEERQLADSFIVSQIKLIADLVAIMTLHAIGVADFMVERFGKIGIAQTTIDILSEAITERKGIQAKGFMVIGKEGDKFVRQEISAEDIKSNLEYLENLLKWIGASCEILPCKAALTVKRNQRQQLEKTIGPSFIDTVLIASEAGSILYTDDERLRSLARSEFKVNGVWTQVLLMKCLNEGTLDRSKYNEYVIQLASLNYRHTSIDAFVLVEAARLSRWTPQPPFTTILKVLDGQHSNEVSALIVGTTFIYELFKQTMLSQQRDQLILALLDTITSKRNPSIVLTRLNKSLERKFYFIPLSLQQVLSVIDAWQKLHIA